MVRTPRSRARLRQIAFWGVVVVVGASAAMGAFILLGVTNVPASLGLIAAGGALVYCLRVLYGIVQTLSRPSVQTVLERSGTVALAGRREVREERHRVLRAIKELDFDHAMGKISAEDFEQVRQGYELRAIEVMRALKQKPDLHPELRAVLEQRRSSHAAPRLCGACDGEADADSKFCKHCGEKLA
jgi:hypothetical protein